MNNDNEKEKDKYTNFKEVDDNEGDGSNSDSDHENFNELATFSNIKIEKKEEDKLIPNKGENKENDINDDSIPENTNDNKDKLNENKEQNIENKNIEEKTESIIPKENENNEDLLNISKDLNLKSPEKIGKRDIDTSINSGGNNTGRRSYGTGNKCPRSTAKSFTMTKKNFKFPILEKVNDFEERTIIGHSNLDISNNDETSQSPSRKKKKKNRRRRKKYS
jgi:hypothetical protein